MKSVVRMLNRAGLGERPAFSCRSIAAVVAVFLCATSVKAQAPAAAVSNSLTKPPAVAKTLPGAFDTKTVLIQDGGSPRSFRIALDEVSVCSAAGRPEKRRAMTAASDVQALRGLASKRRASAGEELDLILYEEGRTVRNEYTCRYLTRQVLVGLQPGGDIEKVSKAAKAVSWNPAPGTADYYILNAGGAGGALDVAEAARSIEGVVYAQAMLASQMANRWVPNDTYFTNQWHLRNTVTVGMDINATNAWDVTRGTGIHIGIVDDGLETLHPDFSGNVDTAVDWDWNGNDNDPNPGPVNWDVWPYYDKHGTAVGGLAGARGHNNLGVAGSAPESMLVGLRLNGVTGIRTTEADVTEAMLHRNDLIFVKNNSWGPSSRFTAPGLLTRNALTDAAATGRGNRGTIMVWAAGNGLSDAFDANYDGYANSIYGIAVAAVGKDGRQTSYSSLGACLLVCAPGGEGSTTGICTTDRTTTNGYNNGTYDYIAYDSGWWWSDMYPSTVDANYTTHFDGTSASAPIVSGVVALMLAANPDLGWRDVQEILIRTCKRNDPTDLDWRANDAGFYFNHKYGAGLVNAGAAVRAATNWPNLGAQTMRTLLQSNMNLAIPDSSASGISLTFSPTNGTLSATNNLRVEHVTVTLDIKHGDRGDLAVTLTSPSGMTSKLAEMQHPEDYDAGDGGSNYVAWTFSSVRHWGESSAGDWTVNVADLWGGVAGTCRWARVDFYGTTNAGGGGGDPGVGTPTGVSASDGTYTDKVSVAWNAVSAATSYEVWRNTDPSSASASNIAEVAVTFCDDTNAVPGVYYYYWVKAKSDAGTGGFSSPDTGYRPLPIPDAPTGVSASDGTYVDKVVVAWTASSGAASYEVWRGADATTNSAYKISVSDVTGASFDDTLGAAGVIYYYWVKAKNVSGTSGFSASDAGNRLIFVPSAPTGVTATDGTYTNKVRVSWSEVVGAGSYRVWRHTANDTNAAARIADSLVGVTRYDDLAAVAGTTYYYWVQAVSDGVPSAFSTPDTGYRQPSLPGVPAGLIAATDGMLTNRVHLTWGTVAEATSYEVWRYTANNSALASKVSSPDPTAPSYDDMTAQLGPTYYYWIKARNAQGASGFSGVTVGYVQSPTLYRVIQLEGDLSFGSVPVGQSAYRVLRIRNAGDGTMQVYSLSLPAGFNGAWSGFIAASGYQDVTLQFSPVESKSYASTVIVNSDRTSGTNTFAMIGYGLPLLRPTGYSNTQGAWLIYNGGNGLTNQFQYSSDLKSWMTLDWFMGNTNGVTLQDVSATNMRIRYYRVYRAP